MGLALSERFSASVRVSSTGFFPRANSPRIQAQSCSESESDSVPYSTVTRCAGEYFWFRNPGRRRTRLQSVQAGSPPNVIANRLSKLSCCSNGKSSILQSTWYLPRDVDTIAVGIGTIFEDLRAASFVSPSVSRSRYRCRTPETLSLVRLRLRDTRGFAPI